MAEVIAELEAVLGVSSGRSAAPRDGTSRPARPCPGALAFLQEDAPVGTLTKQKKPTAAERTQPHIGPEHDTGSNIFGQGPRGQSAKARRRPLVLVGLAGGLVVLLGIVLMLTLRHGTLVVEIDEQLGKDVQVAVSQGGEKVQVVDAKLGLDAQPRRGQVRPCRRGRRRSVPARLADDHGHAGRPGEGQGDAQAAPAGRRALRRQAGTKVSGGAGPGIWACRSRSPTPSA